MALEIDQFTFLAETEVDPRETFLLSETHEDDRDDFDDGDDSDDNDRDDSDDDDNDRDDSDDDDDDRDDSDDDDDDRDDSDDDDNDRDDSDDDDDDDVELDADGVLQVAFLYEAALDRNGNVDAGGLNFWVDRREDGLSERDLARRFLDSEEFTDSFGDADDLEDRAFTETLYENILDRDADEGGLTYWLGQLQDRPDFDREDLLLAFSRSAENREDTDFGGALTEVEDGEWAFV